LRALPPESLAAPLPEAAVDVNYHLAFGVREVDESMRGRLTRGA
ncbi:MAG: hypothetical protein JWQ13_2784, partial [Ramlibacter sp.]|nr:hypothetical protein [Ramlibacter sp.]